MADAIRTDRPQSLWVVGAALALLCLLLRSMRLMALPIFSDEAIYLRWAQLIRAHPWDNAFVSLADPKPPLHFWLMALLWPVTGDPLFSARILSVIAAVLTIPALLLLCRSLETLIIQAPSKAWRDASLRDIAGPSAASFGPAVCVLMIFCPFVAFYQRMALADSLLILETVLVAWLSLQFAAATRRPGSDQLIRITIGLGVMLGLTMLTRQNISYVLWALPIGAFVFSGRPTGDVANGVSLCENITNEGCAPTASPVGRPLNHQSTNKSPGKFLLCLMLAAIIATAIWSPMLLSKYGPDLKTRIFYQPQFTETKTLADRVDLVRQNLTNVFVPTYDVQHSPLPITGWYWIYLTPAVLIGSALGIVWMWWRRQWRLLLFLSLWIVILLAPLILMGNVVYSRYALTPVIPLLILLAYFLTDVAAIIGALIGPRIGALAGGITLVLAITQGVHDINIQIFDWPHQRLIAKDHYQYINGWTAGTATTAAINDILNIAATHPVVVLTGEEWGLPADALWVYLENKPNIQIYYVDDLIHQPILRPAEHPGTFFVRDDKWLFKDPIVAQFPTDAEICYVSGDPVHKPDGMPAEELLQKHNKFEKMIHFYNLQPTGKPSDDGVKVFILRNAH